jgi:oligopeptide transport system substrate-binding protein
MKLKKRVGALLVAVMLISGTGVFVGCGKSNDQTAGVNTSADKKDADQSLNLFLDNPLTLDPNDARNSSEFQIITQVQEGLARIFTDENGKEKVEPAGAINWEVSSDALTWTFHLRDNKWSDGKPVTAQQYVDSFIRLLDPDKAFSYAFFAYDIKNAQAYYEKKAKAEDVGVKVL